MGSILDKLKGGDRRSIGRAGEVVGELEKKPALVKSIVEGILNDDPIIRARCADCLEKFSRSNAVRLQQFKRIILNKASKIPQQEVKWHVAQIAPRLQLTAKEREDVVRLLVNWFDSDGSRIVRVNSLQALVELGEEDDKIQRIAANKVKQALETGTPAVKSRAKRLLKLLRHRHERAHVICWTDVHGN